MVLARKSVVFLSFSSLSFAASSFFPALSLTFLACRRTSREAGSGESLCFFLLFFFLFIVPLIIIDFSSTGDWRSVGVIIPCHYYSSFVSTDVSRFVEHWQLAKRRRHYSSSSSSFVSTDVSRLFQHWRLATGDWLRVRTSLSFSVLFILYPIFRVFAEFSRFDVALPQAEKVGK